MFQKVIADVWDARGEQIQNKVKMIIVLFLCFPLAGRMVFVRFSARFCEAFNAYMYCNRLI